MMNKESFIITKEDGSKLTCSIIATYHNNDINKDYIAYTDNTIDENGKLRVYYSLYEEVNNMIKLVNMENLEEKKIGLEFIKTVLSKLQ